MENCPVCGKHISSAKCCDFCGFDDSRNYEAHITLGPVPAGVRSLAGMRLDYKQKHQNRAAYVNTAQQQPVRDSSIPFSIAGAEKKAEADVPAQENVFPLRYDPYSRVRPVIAAGLAHTVGVKKDGTVIAVGDNDKGQCNVSGWRGIVAVAAGNEHTVGLKKDGTVVAVGQNRSGQCNVSDWRDIVAVAAGVWHTVGLKKDGTVVAVGSFAGDKYRYNDRDYYYYSDWRDIVAIATTGMLMVGLKEDGTVVMAGIGIGDNYNHSEWRDIGDWRDIVQIAIGPNCVAGLKKDGTVIGKKRSGQCNVSDWRDIAQIGAAFDRVVGLNKDGTVVAVGDDMYYNRDMSNWRDIVAIAVGNLHTVGLKKDGTVVAVGLNGSGQTDVGKYITRTERKWFGLFSKTITYKQTPWKLF